MPLPQCLRVAALLASVVLAGIGPVGAARAAADAAAPPVREARVPEQSFSRGDPLPAWAQPLAEVPATTQRTPLVWRLAETQLHVGATDSSLVHRALQVNDATSLSAIGQFTMEFIPHYQKLRLHRVHILRGAERQDRMASTSVRFLERETGLENGVYSGSVTAVLLLEDVRVGDTLHVVYSVEGGNPVLGTKYSDFASWDQGPPVELRRLTLLHPAARRIAWRFMGDYRSTRIRPDESTRNGVRVLRFEERGIEALDEEPHVPRGFVAARYMQFSEYTSWGDVARWARALFPPVAGLPPEAQAVVDRLRTLPSDDEKVVGALRWVQEEVRYFSVSLGESSHRPYPPAQVIQRRYGDCKDKTYLLVSMLRALGIDAKPVLVSATDPRNPARLLPTPLAFDHVIVEVRLADDSYRIDPTRPGQKGRLARLGPVLEGAQALLVGDDSNDLFVLLARDSEQLATTDLREIFTLAQLGGEARLAVRQVWSGNMAEYLRLVFAKSTPTQRRAEVTGGYERRYPGIELVGEPLVVDDESLNSLTVESDFRIPALAKEVNGAWSVPFFPGNLVGAINVPQKLSRNFPAATASVPYHANYRLEVRWPESVSDFRDPLSLSVGSDFFHADVHHSFRGNTAAVTVRYSPRVESVAAKDLPRLVEDVTRLERAVIGIVRVDREAIKGEGSPGLGKRSVQATMAARVEKEIERVSRTIADGSLRDEDLAEALCTRAEGLADRGRPGEGLEDAQRAARVAPAWGRAWQCRGNLLFATGDYQRAVPDYTKAISLGNDLAETLNRRGHARFYAGQYEAAATDFARSAEAGTKSGQAGSPLYRRLWQVWSLQRARLPVPDDLRQLAATAGDGAWPGPALAVAVGVMTPEQLLDGVNLKQGDERELTLAEAWFYLGQHYQALGDRERARLAYEKCREQGVTMYIEHVAAGIELALLKQ